MHEARRRGKHELDPERIGVRHQDPALLGEKNELVVFGESQYAFDELHVGIARVDANAELGDTSILLDDVVRLPSSSPNTFHSGAHGARQGNRLSN
jgi:hypothetical protein